MTVDEIVTLLTELGFQFASTTPEELHYALPGTDLRVSVGPRAVNVYHATGSGKVEFVLNEKTKQLAASMLREAVAGTRR